MFRILIIVQFVLAIYVCWLGAAVFLAIGHSGGDWSSPYHKLKEKLLNEDTITLQHVNEVQVLIRSNAGIRADKYAGLAMQIGIAGLIQALLAASMLICHHQAGKTYRSNV